MTATAATAAGRRLRRAIALLAPSTAVAVAVEFAAAGLLPAMARDFDVSSAEAGHLVGGFALAAAVLGPPLTMAVSRADPRAVLAASLLVFGLGNILAVLVPVYSLVLVVRIVQGAMLPVFVSLGIAAVATLAPAGRQGRAIAQVNLGVVVGVVLALPAGVALAERLDWTTSFAALGILALIAATLVGLGFPAGGGAAAPSIRRQGAILRDPAFISHLLLSAAVFTAMFAAYTYLSTFLEAVAGFGGAEVALALAGFGLAGLLGNEIAGRIVDRGPIAATAGAAGILGVATAAVSLAGGALWALLPLLAIWGAAHTAIFVLCQVRVVLAGSRAKAFASSLNIAACNLGIALGAAGGGWVTEAHGIGAIGFGAGVLAAFALGVAAITARLDRRPMAGAFMPRRRCPVLSPAQGRTRRFRSL